MVRRVVPGETGPSGGPALTDVLGTCVSWSDGVCVVEPDGPDATGHVRIPLADIVSGKPVPPRTPVRHRVSPQEAQLRALALWPDLETQPLGDWLLRSSATSTARRANSVLAMAPSGTDDDYDRVVGFYDANVHFFDDLGSPGGAAKMGEIDKDHELVAALPPQEHDE